MRFKSVFSPAVAAAAFLCLPAVVQAQETHTITPHFPDNFKLQFKVVNDEVQDSQGKRQTTHSAMTASGEVTRQGNGYHGNYRVDSFDIDEQGGDQNDAAGEAMKRQVLDAIKNLPAEVTLDANLDPVRIDNLDAVKAEARKRLTASNDPN
ncbi:MAG: hypothetical protein JF615_12055, partial [Asticcacaulis sp.]|nr:hypothetical protein [Asticcacaulis sp.]